MNWNGQMVCLCSQGFILNNLVDDNRIDEGLQWALHNASV